MESLILTESDVYFKNDNVQIKNLNEWMNEWINENNCGIVSVGEAPVFKWTTLQKAIATDSYETFLLNQTFIWFKVHLTARKKHISCVPGASL